jgi:hypothetical protein
VRPRKLFAAPLITVAAAIAIAGCGSSQTSQVRAKVMQFATATHDHNYKVICTQVLSAQLLADILAGGLSCEQALKLGLGKVQDATMVLGKIDVTGSGASVQTLTQARGEKTTLATLELTRTAGGWRIQSLGNAAAG